MMLSKKMYGVVMALAAGSFAATGVVRADTIYVDATSECTTSCGGSWATAYADLQVALSDPLLSDETVPDTIKVADGVYRPDSDCMPEADPCEGTEGTRSDTFQLKNNVTIEGGYAGYGDGGDTRNIDTYETILSGDLNGDDEPNFANYDDNSYHVVTGSGTTSAAVLDGFTVTGGNASANGGGMCARRFCVGGSSPGESCAEDTDCPGGTCPPADPTISNCTFTYNKAGNNGAGISSNGALTVTSCDFRRNFASAYGPALHADGLAATITSCSFTENSAAQNGGAIMAGEAQATAMTVTDSSFTGNFVQDSGIGLKWGGAIYVCSGTTTISNCTFEGNHAKMGGAFSQHGGTFTIVNSTFSGNTATKGGALADLSSTGATVLDCTIAGNHASNTGGGVYIASAGSVALTNCIIWGNTAPTPGTLNGIEDERTGDHVTYSCVQDNTPGTGNHDDDPDFVRDPSDGGDGWGPIGGGANDDFGNLHLRDEGSPCIDAGDNDAIMNTTECETDEPCEDDPVYSKCYWEEYCGIATDRDGNPRVVDGDVDMGAFEYPGCLTAADCADDGDVCTDDDCTNNTCEHTYNTASCDDGKDCTENDECDGAGTCEGDPSDEGTWCQDGLFCTVGDKCNGSGTCVGGMMTPCKPWAPKCCEDVDWCVCSSCGCESQ